MTMTPEMNLAVQDFRAETQLDAQHAPARPRYVVHALGRDFLVSDEMAQIFVRQVERVAADDSSALVVLRHEQGVELLMVTDDNAFSIRAMA